MGRKDDILSIFQQQITEIDRQGLTKGEYHITSAQGATVTLADGRQVINLCANNYLGLANDKGLIDAAKEALDTYGYGLSSVRFICGTQDIHKMLEQKVSEFLSTDDTILYSSCFDANGGLFETLLGEGDAIVSDELNHASIIDGIRLCKAKRYRYKNNNMASLKDCLEGAKNDGARIIMIATDGVFSMDGIIANLSDICDLADQYNALVMVDDSHATGFVGKTGRGTSEYCGVTGRVDIITGTFGKALGGASGGFTSGRREIIDLLRQRSRPYLFSNSLSPAMTSTSIYVLDQLSKDSSRIEYLNHLTEYYRNQLHMEGFTIIPGVHPIVPIMLYDEHVACEMAKRMMEKGVYVVAFTYPVVPKGKARIRTQLSAAHTKKEIDYVVRCFREVREEMERKY